MSQIKRYHESHPEKVLFESRDYPDIQEALKALGVRFERWRAGAELEPGADQQAVLEAYQADIDRLIAENGYQSVDVVSMHPDHPEKMAFREKFLSEHTHSEDEVRFFVAGQGLFSLHIGDQVCEILCEQGDLISVPAHTPHWFDMGANPSFIAIRLFNNPQGWVANFTGSDIAENFSRLVN